MLKTCNRCRSRRIKCDAQLPACRNCHKAGLPCSFYDHVLKEDIPRSYIKSLRDRVDELTAVLAVHERANIAAAAAAAAASNSARETEKEMETSCGDRQRPDPSSSFFFRYELPTRSCSESLVLGPAPPVVIGDCAIRKLLQLGVSLSPPSIVGSRTQHDDDDGEQPDFGYIERGAHILSNSTSSHQLSPAAHDLPPATVRLLLAHFSRCIEPAFPLQLVFAAADRDAAHSLRQLPDPLDRCIALLACAVAAAHKSYHAASWRSVARACRDWAAGLAEPLIACRRRDDHTVIVLLLLALYELADPDRGRVCDFVDAAIETCLELGWNRAFVDIDRTLDDDVGSSSSSISDSDSNRKIKRSPSNGTIIVNTTSPVSNPSAVINSDANSPIAASRIKQSLEKSDRKKPLAAAITSPTSITTATALTTSKRTGLLSVLIGIERSLCVLSQHQGILTNILPARPSNADRAYVGYHQVMDMLFVDGALASCSSSSFSCSSTSQSPQLPHLQQQCPATVQPLVHVLAVLRTLPPDQPMAQEAWLLLLPLLVDHAPCIGCSLVDGGLGGLGGLHACVARQACLLADSAHTILASPHLFLPPVFAAYRAFMAACVLVTGIASGWLVQEHQHTRALLKCSEVLAFVAPCWRGGRDYYDVFRQISEGLQ